MFANSAVAQLERLVALSSSHNGAARDAKTTAEAKIASGAKKDLAEKKKYDSKHEFVGVHTWYPSYETPVLKGTFQDRAVDIIAVHGLGTEGYRTWAHKSPSATGGKDEVMWLRDFLPHHIPYARIATFHYLSDWHTFGKGVQTSLNELAEELLHCLYEDRRRRSAIGRPIVFIAHSMGGLVVKKTLILARMHSERDDISASTAGVVFLGTPHGGTDTAFYGALYAHIRLNSGCAPLLRSLQTDAEELRELASTFAEDFQDLSITCFYEKMPNTYLRGLVHTLVVNQKSATGQGKTFRYLTTDHSAMNKFFGQDDPNFQSVLPVIQDLSNEAHIIVESSSTAMSHAVKAKIESDYRGKLPSMLHDWVHVPPMLDAEVDLHYGKIPPGGHASMRWVLGLEVFRAWQAGDKQTLWIYGPPRCGKSVTASIIVHHLRGEKDARGLGDPVRCYHAFIQRHDPLKNNPTAVIKMLLGQIIDDEETLSAKVKRMILSDHQREPSGPSDGGNFDYWFSILRKYLGMQRRVYVVIDGLDDCNDSGRFAERLAALANAEASDLCVLFISQKTPTLSTILETQCSIIDMQSTVARQLIDNAMRYVIHHELRKGRIGEDTEAIVETVVSEAQGLFLWAVLAVTQVVKNYGLEPYLRKEALLESIKQLPQDMDSVVLTTLERLLPENPEDCSKSGVASRSIIRKILQWTFHAIRPLSLAELKVATTLPDSGSLEYDQAAAQPSEPDEETLKRQVELCYPLLSLHDDVVQMMHPSFKDLVAPRYGVQVLQGIRERLGDTSLHGGLARACVNYLMREDVLRTCVYLSAEDWEARVQTFSFLKYAVTNLGKHLTIYGTADDELASRIKMFLESDQAVYWFDLWTTLGLLEGDQPRVMLSQMILTKGRYFGVDCFSTLMADCLSKRLEAGIEDSRTTYIRSMLAHQYLASGQLGKVEVLFGMTCDLYNKTLPDSDERRLTANLNLAHVYSRKPANYKDAERLYLSCIAVCRDSKRKLSTQLSLTKLYLEQGRLPEVEKIMTGALKNALSYWGEADYRTGLCLQRQAEVRKAQGQYQEAKDLALRSYAIHARLDGPESGLPILAKALIASAEHGLKNYAEALRLYDYILKWEESTLGPRSPAAITTKNNRAITLGEMGRLEDLRALYENLENDCAIVWGKYSRSHLTVLHNLANNLDRLNQPQRAIEIYETVLYQRKSLLGPNHQDAIITRLNLGRLHHSEGRTQPALDQYIEAFQASPKIIGSNHPLAIRALMNIVDACVSRMRSAVAEVLNERAMKLISTKRGETCPEYIESQLKHGRIFLFQGRWNESRRWIEAALRNATTHLGPESWTTLQVKAALATLLRQEGRVDMAQEKNKEILSRTERLNGATSEKAMYMKLQLAITYRMQGCLSDSQPLAREVFEHRKTKLGPEVLPTVEAELTLARVNTQIGELESAERQMRHVLAVRNQRVDVTDRLTMDAMQGLATVLRLSGAQDKGRLQEAQRLQLEVVSMREQKDGAHHFSTLESKCEFALLMHQLGSSSQAEGLLRSTVEDQLVALGEQHHFVQKSQSDLEMIQRFLGLDICVPRSVAHSRPEKTRKETLTEALEDACAILGPKNNETLCISRDLALIFAGEGQTDLAQQRLSEVLTTQLSIQNPTNSDTLQTLGDLARLHSKSKTDLIHPGTERSLLWAIEANAPDLVSVLLQTGADQSVNDEKTGYTALCYAVHQRHEGCVRRLSRTSARADHVEKDGLTALHIAAANGDAKILSVLVTMCDKVDCLDVKQRRSALVVASACGHHEAVKQLLNGGANPDLPELAINPIHVASANGHCLVVDALLEADANIEAQAFDMTPVRAAVQSGRLNVLKILLSKGAKLDASNSHGSTALHMACRYGHRDIVSHLLGVGEDIEAKDSDGYRPIQLAAKFGKLSVLEELLAAGTAVVAPGGQTGIASYPLDLSSKEDDTDTLHPLSLASREGHQQVVERLLKAHSDPNWRQRNGLTPLHFAAARGHLGVVKLLLSAGSKTDVGPPKSRNSPLTEAVFNKHFAVVEHLLASGADGRLGTSPVLGAVKVRRVDILSNLLSNGKVNVDTSTDGGLTPLHLACYMGEVGAVTKLVEHGAKLDPLTKTESSTPLHYAAMSRHRDIIEVLISNGADESLTDCFGRRPIDWVGTGEQTLKSFRDKTCTPVVTQQIRIRQTIHEAALQARDDISKREDLLGVMGSGLLLVGEKAAARIAFEQSIIRLGGTAKIQHPSVCTMCDDIGRVTGQLYVCSVCSFCRLCTKCFKSYREGKRPHYCNHDDFITVPRPSWTKLEVGIVDALRHTPEAWLNRPGTRNESGITLEEWLSGIAKKCAPPDERLVFLPARDREHP